MNSQLLLLLVILFTTIVPLRAQEGDNLFQYWQFYSDAPNSMYKSSCSLAFAQLDDRKQAIAQLKTQNDHLSRQEVVRQKLLRLMGPFPERTPLNSRVTRIIKRDDYRVENLIYESMPGFYVTASLFLPNSRKGRSPAIVYASGHTVNGYRSETYQHIISNLVKKGFVVLAFDPVGQGERLQYYQEELGKSSFGPTTEHSYPGAQCYVSGYSPTKYFVWDGIRSVDYLLTRKEVDPARIGMTGRSGGGTQTAYTAAIDNRILAAAPECFITSMEYILKSIGPQDAEQNVYHMIAEGLDHADLLEVRAPKPALMITTTGDFFSIQGARETYHEVEGFYDALGSREQVSMTEDDDVHASTRKNREAMYAFFQKHLNNPGNPVDLEVNILEEKELWATKTGQLSTSLKSETIFSLNRSTVEHQLLQLDNRRVDPRHLELLPTAVARISGFELPPRFERALFSGRTIEEDHVIEKYLLPRTDPYAIPMALLSPVENRSGQVVLLLDESGMDRAAKRDTLVDAILSQGHSLLLFDLPGFGTLGPGYLQGDAYIDNTSYNQWFAGILTGKSLVAIRTEDILRVVNFVKHQLDWSQGISIVSWGSAGSEVLHAAFFEDTIQRICLVGPFLSFAEIARSPRYSPRFIPSTVAGALESYDLPDLIAGLHPRKVLIMNPVNANGSPSEESMGKEQIAYPLEVYGAGDNHDKLKLHFQDAGGLKEAIQEWMK